MANQPTKYRKFVVGAASAALVASAVAPVASAKDFSDSKGNTHEAAIDALSDAGIISGYEDGTFKPNKTLTRSDVVKMMGKWLVSEGYEVPSDYKTNMRFSDLTASTNDELLKFAAVVKDNGVFNGSNGRLLAGDNMSRENMAVVLVRAFDTVNDINLVEYVEGQDFKKEVTDLNSAKSEARTAINVLDFFDVTTVAQFNPKDTTTRGHFATFLNNFLKADLSNVTGTVSGVAAVKAVNATTVEVTFADKVENVGGFTIEGLTVSNAAVKQSNDKVVVLTTSVQEGGKKYTVSHNGKELGSFEGVSAVIPTKIDITTQSVQGKTGEQAKISADVGVKQAGIPVTFNVKAETNTTLNKDQVFEAVTDENGIATFSYTQYAAGTDEVVAYPTGAPTVRSHAFVFWGVDTILTIAPADKASEDKGNTLNNGEDKTYKLTYLDPKTGKPVANQRFFVTLEENINVNVDKLSKATVNGENPRQLLNNENPVVASVTTDSKGEAVFTVSGSNTAVTPVVFIDNGDKDYAKATTYEASKLQAKAEKLTFAALQQVYTIDIARNGDEEAATGYSNGRKYTITIKDKDGKVAANELVNVALNEDIDRNINTNTSARFVEKHDAAGNPVVTTATNNQITVKTNAKGEATFVVVTEKGNTKDYATPIAWIDINSSNAKEGKFDDGEPYKIAPITYFATEKLTKGAVAAFDATGEVPRTSKTEFRGDEVATFKFVAANQSGNELEVFPTGYDYVAATFTVFNTGENDVTVILPGGEEHVVSANRSYTTKTITGFEAPSISVVTGNEDSTDLSAKVRVVANGTAVPESGSSVRPINLGSDTAEATFVSSTSVGTLYTGIVESLNTNNRTIKFFNKNSVSYASATFKNQQGVALSLTQFEKLMAANLGNAKVTYKKVDDKVSFEIVSVAIDEVTADYSTLQTAIADANILVNAAKAGTEAGQYPQSAIDTYKAAIRTAQTVLGNVDATQDQVDTAKANLDRATQAFNDAKIVNFTFTVSDATAIAEAINFTIDIKDATVGTNPAEGLPQVVVNIVDTEDNSEVAVKGLNATAFAEGESTVTVTTDALAEGVYKVTVTVNGVEKELELTVTPE